jgi:hypothetical protein
LRKKGFIYNDLPRSAWAKRNALVLDLEVRRACSVRKIIPNFARVLHSQNNQSFFVSLMAKLGSDNF